MRLRTAIPWLIIFLVIATAAYFLWPRQRSQSTMGSVVAGVGNSIGSIIDTAMSIRKAIT